MTAAAILSHWRRRPLQLVTLILALALATALWSAVQAINAEARASYDRAAAVLGQNALERLVDPAGGRIPVADYVALRRAGWLVSPVIETTYRGVRLLGVEPLTAPPQAGLAGLATGDIDFAAFVTAPGLALAAPETALPPGLPPATAAPDLPVGTVLADIGTVERLTGQTGFTHLVLDPEQPRGIPPLAEVTTLDRRPPVTSGDLAGLTESFRLNLTAFGLLAFAVGLFIVHGAIGLAVEQRRQTVRTLRALGVPLGRILAVVGVELFGFALVAGALGLLLGYVIAGALMPGVAASLRGFYGADVAGSIRFQPAWALSGLAIATAGAAVAGAQAIVKLARMGILAPAQPRAWAVASSRAVSLQAAAGVALLALAAALAAVAQTLTTAFAALAALLLGGALILPGVLSALLALGRRAARGPVAEWALADMRQQIPGLSLALMALLLALATNVGVGTMVGSFRATFTEYLDRRFVAELYVTARTDAEREAVAAYLTPRADAVLPLAIVPARLDDRDGTILAYTDGPTYRGWPILDGPADVWDRLAAGEGVLVNEQLARAANLTLGDPLPGTPALPVLGVYADYGNTRPQAMMPLATLQAARPEVVPRRLAVRVAPEEAAALADALVARFGLPRTAALDQAELRRVSLEVFERTFLVTGALNALTLGVAAFGILTGLLTLASMRLAQVAPVWAMGVTRARLAGLEVARAGGLAALTWVAAVPLGLALAWALLEIVNVVAFGWRLPMTPFPADWAVLLGWALLAAGLAALWPALRLARMAPSDLLRIFSSDR